MTAHTHEITLNPYQSLIGSYSISRGKYLQLFGHLEDEWSDRQRSLHDREYAEEGGKQHGRWDECEHVEGTDNKIGGTDAEYRTRDLRGIKFKHHVARDGQRRHRAVKHASGDIDDLPLDREGLDVLAHSPRHRRLPPRTCLPTAASGTENVSSVPCAPYAIRSLASSASRSRTVIAGESSTRSRPATIVRAFRPPSPESHHAPSC